MIFEIDDFRKNYSVKIFEKRNMDNFVKGSMIKGRIHPWENVYRFAGIQNIKIGPENLGLIFENQVEHMMKCMFDKEIEKFESILVSHHTKTSALLNKYPFQWIDGMAQALGINVKMLKDDKIREIVNIVTTNPRKIIEKLPQQCQEAMNTVLQEGGIVRYGTLAKKYDDEIDFWWNEQPPKSTLGLLRLHSLLYVGKMPMNGRLVKVALIPKDLRENPTLTKNLHNHGGYGMKK